MEIHCETFETNTETEKNVNTISWKYLLRQILVCSGIWTCYFSTGLSFGTPTVLIPQIRREANSSDAVSVEMVSWLSSTLNYSGLVSAPIVAILARLIGRKLTVLFICVTSSIGYIIFYYSKTLTQILISEVVLGPLTATPVTVAIMVLTEYTSPRYRGVFLTLKTAMFYWGIWVANAIGTFFHWKNIGIVAFICSVYSFLTTLMWPESPYWLVNKKRFEDCAASQRWLKGYSKDSEAELELLMDSQKSQRSSPIKSKKLQKKTLKMLKSKLFYKPILLAASIILLYHLSGKLACGMYSLDIFNRISKTESAAYTGMLILDGVSVVGMYIGSGISRFFKRRTLLLVSSYIGVTFLFLISLYLYLIDLKIIVENNIVTISLLTVYSLTISVGPAIMTTTILCEIIPMKYRSSSVLFVGCFANFLMACVLKITPYILSYSGAHGLFLFYFINGLIFTILNYKVLPETKDKTILEIQDELLGRNQKNKLINNLKEVD